MFRYVWEAFHDDGTTRKRFTPDGVELSPDPWHTRQFHLYSFIGADPVRLYVPKGAYFHFCKRRSFTQEGEGETIFIAGWEWPDGYGFFVFLLPDGSTEVSHTITHVTLFERR